MTEFALLNSKQIAAVLGVSPAFVAAVRRVGRLSGDDPFRAGKATVGWVLEWLKSHPDFKATWVKKLPEVMQ